LESRIGYEQQKATNAGEASWQKRNYLDVQQLVEETRQDLEDGDLPRAWSKLRTAEGDFIQNRNALRVTLSNMRRF
jgi:hypothetical protein